MKFLMILIATMQVSAGELKGTYTNSGVECASKTPIRQDDLNSLYAKFWKSLSFDGNKVVSVTDFADANLDCKVTYTGTYTTNQDLVIFSIQSVIAEGAANGCGETEKPGTFLELEYVGLEKGIQLKMPTLSCQEDDADRLLINFTKGNL